MEWCRCADKSSMLLKSSMQTKIEALRRHTENLDVRMTFKGLGRNNCLWDLDELICSMITEDCYV